MPSRMPRRLLVLCMLSSSSKAACRCRPLQQKRGSFGRGSPGARSVRAGSGQRRQQVLADRSRRKRADMFEDNDALSIHDERLRYAVDSPVYGDPAVAVGADAVIGIAEFGEEGAGLLRRILLVDAVEAHAGLLAEVGE